MHTPRHARPSSRRPLAALGVTALAASAVAVPLASHGSAPETRTIIEPVHDASHTQQAPAQQAVLPATAHRLALPGTVTVRPGDTLSAIAGRVCGDASDYLALAYNNDVRNPDLIFAGQVFKVACQAAAQAIADRYPPPVTVSQPVAGGPPRQPRTATQQPAAQSAAVVTSASGTFGCAALEALWEAAGGSPAEAFTAAEIAMAESGGNPDAISPTSDYGLFQINSSNGALATLNPLQNAKSAVILSDDGRSWSAWTTFTSGAFRGCC